jgi:hypothetical protein
MVGHCACTPVNLIDINIKTNKTDLNQSFLKEAFTNLFWGIGNAGWPEKG